MTKKVPLEDSPKSEKFQLPDPAKSDQEKNVDPQNDQTQDEKVESQEKISS